MFRNVGSLLLVCPAVVGWLTLVSSFYLQPAAIWFKTSQNFLPVTRIPMNVYLNCKKVESILLEICLEWRYVFVLKTKVIELTVKKLFTSDHKAFNKSCLKNSLSKSLLMSYAGKMCWTQALIVTCEIQREKDNGASCMGSFSLEEQADLSNQL